MRWTPFGRAVLIALALLLAATALLVWLTSGPQEGPFQYLRY